MVKVTLDGVEESIVVNGGKPLLGLCRKEVEEFDVYLKTQVGGFFREGLAEFEKRAIAGYLYQKIRGRIPEDGQALLTHLVQETTEGA